MLLEVIIVIQSWPDPLLHTFGHLFRARRGRRLWNGLGTEASGDFGVQTSWMPLVRGPFRDEGL